LYKERDAGIINYQRSQPLEKAAQRILIRLDRMRSAATAWSILWTAAEYEEWPTRMQLGCNLTQNMCKFIDN
jgi:hypothetical protein